LTKKKVEKPLDAQFLSHQNLHDLSNLRSTDNSHMTIPQSSPYSVLVVFLRLSIAIDSDSSVDGV
jgi:hypothetical protein